MCKRVITSLLITLVFIKYKSLGLKKNSYDFYGLETDFPVSKVLQNVKRLNTPLAAYISPQLLPPFSQKTYLPMAP